MDPETRLLLIKLAEGFAEGMRNGTFQFTESEGRRMADFIQGIINPQPRMEICSISQACSYLGLSQPTFRKYVRDGQIPRGHKVAGLTELVWNRKDIEEFKKRRILQLRKAGK